VGFQCIPNFCLWATILAPDKADPVTRAWFFPCIYLSRPVPKVLTNIIEKLNSLNCSLQGKGKIVADISALNAFKVKITFSLCIYREKRWCTFPLCRCCWKTMLLHLKFLTKLQKSTLVIGRLGQGFDNRFYDLDQLEPCVWFICNSLMNVDKSCIAQQLNAMFSLDGQQMEVEIVTSQNDTYLKACQAAPNFWYLVDTEKCSGVCIAAVKVASLFDSTYLCE